MNICKSLCKLLGCCNTQQQVRFGFRLGLVQPKTKRKGIGMGLELKITNEQKQRVHLRPVTLTGNPAQLDGKPSWTVESGDSTVEVAEDGMSAMLISADTPGDTIILVEADADLGEGKESISDTIRLSVAGARAANLGLVADDPVAK